MANPSAITLALTVGDPAGIGPETVLAAIADPRVAVLGSIVVIGPAALRPKEIPIIARNGVGKLERSAARVTWLESAGPARWAMGQVQVECGRAALAALRAGHELALTHEVDALVTAPVSKEALHKAGEPVEGQTELLGRWCDVTRFEMVAVAGALRVMLTTRHMPLARAIASITTERVLNRLQLFDETLRGFGIAKPHLALAGLNPHAGERGLLGSEEDEILRPALESARARGLHVSGPVSPDSVFLLASRGAFDGVLALYHDQAFIPIKLLSHDGGVTVIAGLPYVRVSPVHGTAYDIAGRGVASAENLIAALEQAARLARATHSARSLEAP